MKKKINSRRVFLKKTIGVTFGIAAINSPIATLVNAKGKTNKPNIIFIIADDQHKKNMFGFLTGKALTPHLDNLAKEGVYLPNTYTTSSVCTPSRYISATGMYGSRATNEGFMKCYTPEEISRVSWNTKLNKKQDHIGTVLKSAGYVTGAVGKVRSFHSDSVKGKKIPGNADPSDPKIKKLMKEYQQELVEDTKKHSGFDYAASLYAGNLASCPVDALNQHNMEYITKGAVDFIEKYHDKPFFLWMAPTLLHGPTPYDSLVSDPRISNEGLLDSPITGIQPSRESVIERNKKAGYDPKYSPATWLDDGVGAVLDKLEKYGIGDNTFIFYFLDNGTGGKTTLYETGVGTKSIVRWRNKIKSGQNNAFVQNIDFAPTIFDACDVKPPKKMKIDGKSLMPVLRGKSKEVRDSMYCEMGLTRAVTKDGWKYLAYRIPPSIRKTGWEIKGRGHEDYMYIWKGKDFPLEDQTWTKTKGKNNIVTHLGERPGGRGSESPSQKMYPYYYDADQLYNLNDDKDEQNNLAYAPKYSKKLKEMKNLLQTYLNDLPGKYAELKK